MRREATGPVDEPALETLREIATSHELVARVYVADDDGGRTRLFLHLDDDRYPPSVRRAVLRAAWFRNDDYTFHYREEWEDGSAWQCRWDSHPHGHDAARTHFHGPPDAAGDPVSDSVREISPHHLFARTMASLRERIEALWASL